MSAKKRRRPLEIQPKGFHRTWHELVKPQRHEPSRREQTNRFQWPAAAGPIVVVDPIPAEYRGGRSPRPSKVYTNDLHRRLGLAFARNHRRRNLSLQEVADRNARAERKAKRIAVSRERMGLS